MSEFTDAFEAGTKGMIGIMVAVRDLRNHAGR
jgi:hypothetical protein